MPRLRDFPEAVRRVGWWTFTKRVWNQIGEDNIFTWAAAMAYSWLFAIFPFLIFLLTLIPYMPIDRAGIIRQVNNAIEETLPEQASDPIIDQFANLLTSPHKGLMSTGIIIALWAASGGMAMTMAALNTCYDVKETRPFYIARPLAVLLTLIVASLIICITILLPIGTGITRFVRQYLIEHGQDPGRLLTWTWNFARWSLALVMMVTAVGIVYHFGPGIKRKFCWFTPGSVFTIVMWILLGLGLKYYVEEFAQESYNKTYGAVGGVAILLLIFYLDSVVLLIGAEIDSEADFALLSVPTATAPPETVVDAESAIEAKEVTPDKAASPDKPL